MARGGRIAGITIELNGDATKLTKALADVDRSARQSQNNLKDINKLLKLDPGNTELLQQKFNNLTTSIDSTKQRLETLKEAAAQMELGGKANTPEWDALQREIADTEQHLRSLNREMDQFGSVGAQRIAAAGDQVQQVGEKIEGAGKAIMPASAAMIGFGTVAASKYAEVDKVMTLTNQTMGNTAEQAELLESAMAKAASNSTSGMSDAANACLNFARAGLSAEEAAAALAPAMNLAAGEGGNLDTVSAGLVQPLMDFMAPSIRLRIMLMCLQQRVITRLWMWIACQMPCPLQRLFLQLPVILSMMLPCIWASWRIMVLMQTKQQTP